MSEFEQIYRSCFRDVFLYLRRLSKNESVAEELTSETFFKAMQSLSTFRGDCDVRVWLCQIAKNSYYTYCKKQQRVTELDDAETDSEAAAPDDMEARLVEQTDAMRIHLLLHKLPEPYKEVFSLRVFGELSFRQIAAVFQKTENWACVTYHRARKKMIEQMEADNHE